MERQILVIDDHKEMGRLFEMLLKEEGYKNITIEDNGEKGIKRAMETNFDLILLDVYMPKIDGRFVYDFLKSHPRTKNVPIIFITSLDVPANGEFENLRPIFSKDNLDGILKQIKLSLGNYQLS